MANQKKRGWNKDPGNSEQKPGKRMIAPGVAAEKQRPQRNKRGNGKFRCSKSFCCSIWDAKLWESGRCMSMSSLGHCLHFTDISPTGLSTSYFGKEPNKKKKDTNTEG